MLTILVILGLIIVFIALYYVANTTMYKKVGPNEVLIISGGKRRKVTDPDGTVKEIGYRYVVGGGAFINPVKETAQILPLEVYSIGIKTPEVLTAKGIHIIAEATAQVKIASDDYSIRQAAEQFLSTGAKGIKEVSEQILEGYTRAVLGSLTVEEIYQNRDDFNQKVTDNSKSAFGKMGLTLISFTLKDISDTQGYLTALGKPRIAEVKRDAEIAEAEAEKETIIKSAAARRDGDIAKFQAEAQIAAANRDYELSRTQFQAEVNKEKAKTDLAYELQRQTLNQEIRKAEYAVKLVEKTEAIKLEEAEILRKEKELESSIKKQADALKYRIEKEAEAEKLRKQIEAEGKAEAIKTEGMAEIEITKQKGISKIAYEKNLGLAEAEVKKAQGEAEAYALQKKAESFAVYNEAAVYQMLMDKLPDLAKAVSEPLSKVDKIVMVGEGADGASKLTGQVAKILAQLPTVVENLSGVDLTKFFEKAKAKQEEKKLPSVNGQ
jgi:flotillin